MSMFVSRLKKGFCQFVTRIGIEERHTTQHRISAMKGWQNGSKQKAKRNSKFWSYLKHIMKNKMRYVGESSWLINIMPTRLLWPEEYYHCYVNLRPKEKHTCHHYIEYLLDNGHDKSENIYRQNFKMIFPAKGTSFRFAAERSKYEMTEIDHIEFTRLGDLLYISHISKDVFDRFAKVYDANMYAAHIDYLSKCDIHHRDLETICSRLATQLVGDKQNE